MSHSAIAFAWHLWQTSLGEGSEEVWQSLQSVVERDHIIVLSVIFALVSAAMLRFVPSGRRRVRAAIWLYGFAVALLVGAALLSAGGLKALAGILHWTGLLVGGIAFVNLLGVLFFDILLTSLSFSTPRILRDLVIALSYLGVALLLMSRSGMSLSGIVTTSAVITAVIGFSLQDTLGNVIGGLAIQMEKTIQPGDWVEIGDQVGRVTEIRWRYTAIETRNWDTVLIPNSTLMKSQVLILGRRAGLPVNHRQWVYFNVDFRYSPTEVIEAVNQKLQSDKIPGVADDPKAHCILMDFKDSYCQYAVRYWLTDLAINDPTDSLVRARIYFALKRRGIPLSIPAAGIFLTEDNEARRLRKEEKEIEQRLRILSEIELFQVLTEDERRRVAGRMKHAPFSRGEAVMRQGTLGEWLYIITRGTAEVRIYQDAEHYITVAKVKAGDFLGEMSLLTGELRTATVIALEEMECYRLDGETFRDLITARPQLAEYIAEVLARRRTELQAAREGLSDQRRHDEMRQTQHDILRRIYQFFSLGSASASD